MRKTEENACGWLFINLLRAHASAKPANTKQFSGNLSKISEMPINNLAAWSVDTSSHFALLTSVDAMRSSYRFILVVLPQVDDLFGVCARYSNAYHVHALPYGCTWSAHLSISVFCHFLMDTLRMAARQWGSPIDLLKWRFDWFLKRNVKNINKPNRNGKEIVRHRSIRNDIFTMFSWLLRINKCFVHFGARNLHWISDLQLFFFLVYFCSIYSKQWMLL